MSAQWCEIVMFFLPQEDSHSQSFSSKYSVFNERIGHTVYDSWKDMVNKFVWSINNLVCYFFVLQTYPWSISCSWAVHNGPCPVVSCCVALGQMQTEDLFNRLSVQAVQRLPIWWAPAGNRWKIFLLWPRSIWCTIRNVVAFMYSSAWTFRKEHMRGSSNRR